MTHDHTEVEKVVVEVDALNVMEFNSLLAEFIEKYPTNLPINWRIELARAGVRLYNQTASDQAEIIFKSKQG